MNNQTLTAERVRYLLSYDADTGVFVWRVGRGGTRAWSVAGTLHPNGYVYIKIDGRLYLAHRLAWLYTHGAWPADQLDHRDGNKSNNCISNLREATRYHKNETSNQTLTAERLRELLEYDPETGAFTWRVSTSNRVRAGSVAGHLHSKWYINIQIDGRLYLAHRLAWLYIHGAWPEAEIDHIDDDPSNNRLANLREVTNQKNHQNQRRANTDSSTGLIGASPKKGKFQAQIMINNKKRFLGYFETPEAAHEAYIEAKRQHQFTRHNLTGRPHAPL